MPHREARSVAESSEGPTASKSDRTGRNPGMTRLVRRSSSGVWRYCVFLSCSNIKYRTIYRISQELINFNETIEPMNSHIADIIRNNGEKLKSLQALRRGIVFKRFLHVFVTVHDKLHTIFKRLVLDGLRRFLTILAINKISNELRVFFTALLQNRG